MKIVLREIGPKVRSTKSCPIGLFITQNGELCVRTEYWNNGKPEAYIVSTGEFYAGTGQIQPMEIENIPD